MILPRPRTVLFALSGLTILYGIWRLLRALPDPTTFSGEIGDCCWFIILGAVGCVLTMMWNSKALTKEWLGVAELSLKAVGAILFLIFGQWFAQLQHEREVREQQGGREYQAQLKSDERTRDEQSKRELAATQDRDRNANERRDQDTVYRLNSERADQLLKQFAENRDYPAGRKAAVAIAGGHLRDSLLKSLVLAQAIHTVVLYDPDPSVQRVARDVLFPGAVDSPPKTDFADGVLTFLTGPNVAKAQEEPYRDYLRLIADHHTNEAFRKRATDTLKESVAEQVKALAIQSAPAGANPGGEAPPEPPSILLVATAREDLGLTRRAATLLANTTPERVEQTLETLPESISRKVPPRVYLHIAEEGQRPAAQALQTALIEVGFIVPAIQNVAGKAYVPLESEVRYFASDNRTAELARKIAAVASDQKLVRRGLKLSPEKPSARDFKISTDITSHFEVWFAALESALPGAAPAGKSGAR